MRLGEFELTQLLGVGGFGMVYQAFDHALLRFVAIKEYMPVALAQRTAGHQVEARSGADAQALQAGLDLFIGEARLLAQFDHPSLVKVLRFWQEHGTAYMVMPLYGGMTLRQARADAHAAARGMVAQDTVVGHQCAARAACARHTAPGYFA